MKKNHNNLLIIEDDAELMDILTSYFSQRGFKINSFHQAEEALIEIENERLKPSIILCDFKLPGMSGLEFTRRLNKSRFIPIIFMTASSDLELALEATQAGAVDFVLKPLHFPQLLISIQRTIHLQDLKSENEQLKNLMDFQEPSLPQGVVAKSVGFRKALELARRVASGQSNVLIHGESGTGKEVIARAIHELGNKKDGPFVAINCTAIPENLLESELFGHSKGSFTGAIEKKIGLFEEANKGSLFLDEIGDLSLPLQAKLLRVIQERKVKRLGENQYREITARIICATHKDLAQEVKAGRFREDLYFRLNVIPIELPPLRERKDDILPLSSFFLKKFMQLNQTVSKSFSPEALEYLVHHHWKGNVRELENAIERAVVLSEGAEITLKDLNLHAFTPAEDFDHASISLNSITFTGHKALTLEEVSKKYIQEVFHKNEGAKEQTARELGIDRKTLYRKLKEMELN